MTFQIRLFVLSFLVLFFINQLVISQNDYLKNDSSIYAFDIGRLPKVKNEWKFFIIKNKSYFIGLYMFRGSTYTDKVIKVIKPYKKSMEAIMIQPRYKYSFFDFSSQKKTKTIYGYSRKYQLYIGECRKKN